MSISTFQLVPLNFQNKISCEQASEPSASTIVLFDNIFFLNLSRDTRDAPSPVASTDVHLKEVEEQLQNIFTPTPIELLKVTLVKKSDVEDFGFSLSDGVFEKGVYIGAIRPGGPAAEELRPYDRILQVNDSNIKICYFRLF